MKKVLVCDRIEIGELKLGNQFVVDYKPTIEREELINSVNSYDVIVVRSRTKVDSKLIDRAKSLKLVARVGTGLDNIDVEYASKRGIAVVNSPEALVEAVCEHTMLLMLSLCRDVVDAVNSTLSGKWEKDRFYGTELKGKTLGVVGLGKIGKRVAQIARCFGMDIKVYDVITLPKDTIEMLSAEVLQLDQLLPISDFVTIHVPLTKETYHMLDEKRIRTMKRGSYLINTSRGSVIEEKALIEALQSGSLAGAALDVFESEPPSEQLRRAPNVLLTPHIAGQTKEAQRLAVSIIAEKIRNYFNTAQQA